MGHWVTCVKAQGGGDTSFGVEFNPNIVFSNMGADAILTCITDLKNRCDPNTDDTMLSYEAIITHTLINLAKRGLVVLHSGGYDETKDKTHRCLLEKI